MVTAREMYDHRGYPLGCRFQPLVPKSTARVSLRKYFIPGCVGRGRDLDFRVRPAAAEAAEAAAASGNPGICPLGIEVEKPGFRTAWLITGQKIQGLGLKLTAVILTFRDPHSHLCQKNVRMAI